MYLVLTKVLAIALVHLTLIYFKYAVVRYLRLFQIWNAYLSRLNALFFLKVRERDA